MALSPQFQQNQNGTVDPKQYTGNTYTPDSELNNQPTTDYSGSGDNSKDPSQTGVNSQDQMTPIYTNTTGSNDGMVNTQNDVLLSDGKISATMEQEQLVDQFLTNSQYPLQEQIQSGGSCETADWNFTNLQARDVGVNSEGELYAAGLDGYLYFYEFLNNRWKKVDGDYEMTSIKRVDVSYDGVPYVVTSCGDTFYLSCENRWIRLPGCAKDIGTGRGGEIFKTGCDEREGGYGVYRLFCKCECKNCYQGCQRWKKARTCSGNCDEKKKCYWFRIDGGGVRIDVAPSGWPYVINADQQLQGYDGTDWVTISGIKFIDVTVSNEGLVFAIAMDGTIYKVNSDNTLTCIDNEKAFAITAGPYSQPFIVNSQKKVLTTSKLGFN